MGVSSAAEKEPQKTSEREGGRERLGGARADFVANLGKRRAELRTALDALRTDPSAKRPRDELRRRVHALGAGAKLLRFTRLADELKGLEKRLEEAAQRGALEDGDFGAVHDLIGRMTSLAWGQTESGETKVDLVSTKGAADALRAPTRNEDVARVPCSVLVVGGSSMADALTMSHTRAELDDGQAFEVERTSEADVALDLAKALAPDVAVIDGDVADAKKIVADLLSDPLTESIPVIVTLRIARPDEAGPFLALGVARVLPKPVSPGELRRACAAVISTYVKREVSREPLGDVTLNQLGAKLAEELRRGLCDTVDPDARGAVLKLGEGTELLAALWGAVARIRDVVTIRTQGQVRFAHGGPEGAVPLAPWLEAGDASASLAKRTPGGRLSRADADASLDKVKVLVADDDAAVCWFLAGVLKTAGAMVYEARDGERALEIAKHVNPDLVISDILMPKMDGFALTRVLRRDIVLRDVPIVLLSWKEDLLQRVRELGADADGYLRKEASAGAIVQRVRELVRQRRRVSTRVSAQGEVRGRLDGLTTYSLLRMVCQHRESSTVSVRDASFLYEIEVHKGRPIRATRTALNGSFDRGASVLAALLGVGDGRFSVSPARPEGDAGSVRADLTGSLAEQVMPVVATARAAHKLLSGANLMRVRSVEIDEDAIGAYSSATPEAARSILMSIAAGSCPRDLVAGGAASARLLEDVLVDAAVHGAVIQVIDASGEDRLPSATSTELALLRGERTAAPIAALPVLAKLAETPAPAPPIDVAMPAPADLMKLALARPAETMTYVAVAPAPIVDAAGNTAPLSAAAGLALSAASPAPGPVARIESEPSPDDGRSLMEELSDPWADPVDVSSASSLGVAPHEESPIPPSGPRPSTRKPPVVAESAPITQPSPPAPRAKEENIAVEREPAARELTPTPSQLPPPPGLKPMLTLGSLHPPPVAEQPSPAPVAKPKNVKKSPPAPAVVAKESPKERVDQTPPFPRPSAFLAPPQPKKKDNKTLYWIAFALVGVVFAVWARWSRDKAPSESELIAETDKAAGHAVEPNTGATAAPVDAETTDPQQPEAESTAKAKVEETPVEELPLRDGDRVKKGQGMIEIVAGKSDTVYIDGKPIGSGPVVSLPLKAKKDAYEIKVKSRGEEKSRFVTVKEGKLVRLRLAPPWQR